MISPRFTKILATSFGGAGDANDSAYTGSPVDGGALGASLPYHFPGHPPLLRIFRNGLHVDAPVVDVGPWYPSRKGPADTYWDPVKRPRAESDSRTNHAGIDLTPATWLALGYQGKATDAKGFVDWDFVSYLDAVDHSRDQADTATVPSLSKQVWPLQRDAPRFYPNPAHNLVAVTTPWQMRYGNTPVDHIMVHRKCADSLKRVLAYIWTQCDESQAKIEALHYDRYSGSYAARPMRGGSAPSMHSYGAAIDFDDEENQQHSQHHLFTDDSLIVKAFKAEGWVWGGDWSPSSIDAMHFQAARVHGD
jgi:hypothetical protein